MRLFKTVFCLTRRLSTAKHNIIPTSCVLGTLVASKAARKVFCDGEKLKPPDPTKLTHSYLIRNAASQTINSALALLNQTIVALEETEQLYTSALEKLKLLLEYNMTVLGDPFREDHAWTEIIRVKRDIVNLKQQRDELQFVLENAEKTAYAASEAAFSAGAEQMSIVANERLFSVKLLKDKVGQKSSQLEKDIMKIEVESIEKTMDAQKKRTSDRETNKETDADNENVTEIDLEKLTEQEIYELSEDNEAS